MVFVTSLFTSNKQAKRLVSKILRDRRYLQTNKRFWPLIESYSKFEGKLTRLFYRVIIIMVFFLLTVVPLVGMNKTRLPLDFYIPFLPVDGFSVNWGINYIYQLIIMLASIPIVNAHVGLTILVISHACFKIDTALISLKRFSDSFEDNAMHFKYWRIWNHSVIKSRMKRFVDETNDIIEYTKMAQKFIALPNCADTLIISFMICTSAYAARHNWLASVVCVLMIVSAIAQLALYNFAGLIMLNKVEELVFSVYDTPWYNLHYKRQKDIFFILLVLQNMKGLNSIFNNLCNATFYQVSLFCDENFD